MPILFISDLHLDPGRPQITDLFLRFLQVRVPSSQALYILGDLFEAWVGDDDDSALANQVCEALAKASASGPPIYFMTGNRDFLAGAGFAQRTGVHMLGEQEVLDLAGHRSLLMHGDQLCTDDVDYQRFRAMVRDPQWTERFLAEPLPRRRAVAQSLRDTSQQAMRGKSSEIMDVNQVEVEAAMKRHNVSLLVHGHTHRPAVHDFHLQGRPVTRVVLGDWFHQGSLFTVYQDGHFELSTHSPDEPF